MHVYLRETHNNDRYKFFGHYRISGVKGEKPEIQKFGFSENIEHGL